MQGTRGTYDYLTALNIAVLPFVDLEKIQGFGTEGYWAQCVNRNILEVFGGNVHLKYTKKMSIKFNSNKLCEQ